MISHVRMCVAEETGGASTSLHPLYPRRPAGPVALAEVIADLVEQARRLVGSMAQNSGGCHEDKCDLIYATQEPSRASIRRGCNRHLDVEAMVPPGRYCMRGAAARDRPSLRAEIAVASLASCRPLPASFDRVAHGAGTAVAGTVGCASGNASGSDDPPGPGLDQPRQGVTRRGDICRLEGQRLLRDGATTAPTVPRWHA